MVLPTIEELPETIPVFPLQGALLLPGGQLPLNIFEPRYLAMIDDALSSDRMIGMIQPKIRETIDAEDHPDLYEVGCLGKIASFSETPDGRYLITLVGVCRFELVEELPIMNGYRRVSAKFDRFLEDFNSASDLDIDREQLLAGLKAYLDRRNLAADWDAIGQASTAELVSAMGMICPFAPPEKQALLEAPTLDDMGKVMISLVEMDVTSTKPSGSVN